MRKELDYKQLFALVGRRGDQFNDGWIESVDELIRADGTLVGRQDWDSGETGAGAGTVNVYLFRGVLVSDDDVGSYGPYDNFLDAAAAVGLLERNEATKTIWVDRRFDRSIVSRMRQRLKSQSDAPAAKPSAE